MKDNASLIAALKHAETQLAATINALTATIAKYEKNPHLYVRIPGNIQAEMNANALCCSCDYCMRSRGLEAYYQMGGAR